MAQSLRPPYTDLRTKLEMKILLVDDNAAVRKLIRRVVASHADEIAECSSGNEALAAYRGHRPDLVLMDIEMPDVDGLSATRLILAEDSAARIVMVTNYDDPDLRRSASEAGAQGYVVKENLGNLIPLIKVLWPDIRDNPT
jgi:CheY-like chemotaxis protein